MFPVYLVETVLRPLLSVREYASSYFVKRGKGVVCLFEEAGDGVRRHVEMKLEDKLPSSSFLGYSNSRAGAVENRDDDDQSDCVGKGKLRVLGAFGDSSKSVGSHDCDCSSGSGSLVGIKFELDFHCQ